MYDRQAALISAALIMNRYKPITGTYLHDQATETIKLADIFYDWLHDGKVPISENLKGKSNDS